MSPPVAPSEVSLLHTDARFAEVVEAAVTRLELATEAELVVVAAPRSGSYRDLALAVGVVAAWLALAFVLYSPFHFSGGWLPLELPLVGALAAWAANRSPRLLRLLAGTRRLSSQAQAAAAEAFHVEAVHATRRRTGLLVYLSALEDRVVVIPDLGIEARVPDAAWHDVRFGSSPDRSAAGTLEEFLAGLEAVGAVLARALPATEGDNPDEIANAPRIRE